MGFRRYRWFAILLIALLPAVECYFLVEHFMGVPPSGFVGNYPNDLPGYWHQVDSFRAQGFNSGYYTANEVPPKISLFHFGPHGPSYPILMGSVARLTGWHQNTPVYYNMAMLGLSLIVFALLVELDGIQLLVLFLSVLFCWPMHLMTPTGYQESFFQSVAIVLSAVFFRWLSAKGKSKDRLSLLLCAVLSVLSFFRVSWALLIPAVAVVWARKRFPKQWLASVPASLGWIWVLYALGAASSAPGLNSFEKAADGLKASPLDHVLVILKTAGENYVNLFENDPLNQLLMLQMLLLVLLIPLLLFFGKYWKKSDFPKAVAWSRSFFPEGYFHWYNAASIFFAALTLYLLPGFFRLFSATIIMTWLMLILSRRYAIVGFLIVSNLLLSAYLVDATRQWTPNFRYYPPAYLEQVKSSFEKLVKFDTRATSPWCNTVLTNFMSWDARHSMLPSGMGISILIPFVSPAGNIRSKYVLLTKRDFAMLNKPEALQSIGVLPGETLALFLNKHSDCADQRSN